MKYSFIDILAGIISAIIASMGLGGGGVYIMYLTLVKNTPQINAQGLNLLFFIPCAAVSLIIYIKNKMIKPKAVIPMALGGGVGADYNGRLHGFFKNRKGKINCCYFQINMIKL